MITRPSSLLMPLVVIHYELKRVPTHVVAHGVERVRILEEGDADAAVGVQLALDVGYEVLGLDVEGAVVGVTGTLACFAGAELAVLLEPGDFLEVVQLGHALKHILAAFASEFGNCCAGEDVRGLEEEGQDDFPLLRAFFMPVKHVQRRAPGEAIAHITGDLVDLEDGEAEDQEEAEEGRAATAIELVIMILPCQINHMQVGRETENEGEEDYCSAEDVVELAECYLEVWDLEVFGVQNKVKDHHNDEGDGEEEIDC